MATLLEDIVELVNDRRRDTTANSVDMTTDGFRAINSALQIWDSQHNWPWQLEKYEFNYNDGVDTYELPASINFKAIADLEARKAPRSEFYFLKDGAFDTDTIHTYKFAVKNEGQRKYLRVKYAGNSLILNQANSVDSDGTWVGAGAISNVAKDEYESLTGLGSLKYDYSGTSGTLTNSDMQVKNVTLYAQRSTIYFDVYIQDATNLTSFTLKLGSSASDYITAAVTTDYLGRAFKNGYNRVGFTWNGTTSVVGTPDNTVFNYIQITEAYSSNPSVTSNRIENIFISENVPLVLDFYSHNMVYDDSGDAKLLEFNDASAGSTDYPLFSGEWDYAKEPFINSVLEIIFWLTGETSERDIAIQRIQSFVEPLKSEMPSRKRYPEMQIKPDLNY
jgi:hypothetical protein